jgi:hypothetical protein
MSADESAMILRWRYYKDGPELRRIMFLGTTLQRLRRPAAYVSACGEYLA